MPVKKPWSHALFLRHSIDEESNGQNNLRFFKFINFVILFEKQKLFNLNLHKSK